MLSPLLIGEEKQGQGMPEGQGDGKRQVSRLAEAEGEKSGMGGGRESRADRLKGKGEEDEARNA